MNLVTQFRAFWVAEKLLRDCGIPLKSNHKTLYFALFNIANSTHWKEWFSVTQKQGMDYSGLSINTYFKCLYELEYWGLIKLKHKGNKYKATQVNLPILISDLIYKHENSISEMIYRYIKSDIQPPKTYISFETILKQELKLLKTGGDFSFFEEKKPKPAITPRRVNQTRKDLTPLT